MRCKRCGRELKNPESVERCFGSVCYKKMIKEKTIKPLWELVKDGEKNNSIKIK